VQRVLGGISGAAAGLVIAAAFRMLTSQHRHPVALLFAALAFSGIVLAHLPLTLVVAGLAPLSIGASWLRWRAR